MEKVHKIHVIDIGCIPTDVNNICESYYLSNDMKNYFSKQWHKFPKNKVCDIAIENGWIDLLDWSSEYMFLSQIKKTTICEIAAKHGHTNIIGWACKKLRNLNKPLVINGRAFVNAAKYSHFDTLKWLIRNCSYENKKWINEVCAMTAKHNNFDMLKWIKYNISQYELNDELDGKTCAMAALSNNLEMLKWLVDNDFPVGYKCYAYAAFNGNIEMLDYLYTNVSETEWNWTTLTHALLNCHLDVFEWAKSKGCEPDKQMCKYFKLKKCTSTLKLIEYYNCCMCHGEFH